MKKSTIFNIQSGKKMFYYGLVYILLQLSTRGIEAQTLNIGDIAVVGMNASYNMSGAAPIGPDEFTIVVLADILPGTVIKITDRGWNGSSLMTTNTEDGAISWTITSYIQYGTVFRFSVSSGASPSVSVDPASYGVPLVTGGWTSTSAQGAMSNVGDQIIIYQGNDIIPSNFIYGFTTHKNYLMPKGEWQLGSTSASDSNLPPGLFNNPAINGFIAATALAFTGPYFANNFVYMGPKVGDKISILHAIGTYSNWIYTSDLTFVFSLAPGGYYFPVNPAFRITSLPVSLLGFDGRRQSDEVILFWQTASEKNNRGFEVQQSVDNGVSFHTITFVEGSGDSHEISNYDVSIYNPAEAHYRLKQVDYDGTSTYSPVLYIEGVVQATVSVKPNPFAERITLTGDSEQSYQMVLTDTYGRHVASYTGLLHQLEIALNNTFATQIPGVYWLQIVGASRRDVLQLIKAE